MKLIDLGWCMARLDTTKNWLTIISPSDGAETGNSPAESVVVYGPEALRALRDALNEAYPPTVQGQVAA